MVDTTDPTTQYERGTTGADDIGSARAIYDQIINAGLGNDVVRGGKGDDRIIGGEGDDIVSGGAGADQFYFEGDSVTGTDVDRVTDLSFAQGDSLVFDDFGLNFFGGEAKPDYNVFDDGNDAIVTSFAGLHAMVDGSNGAITATVASGNLLILTIDFGNDQFQVIRLSGAASGYEGVVPA